MEVEERLEELTQMVEQAKAVPLSASCMVNRAQVLDLIEDIRDALPSSLDAADQLLAERESVVAEGRREADRIIAEAGAMASRSASTPRSSRRTPVLRRRSR